MGQRLRWGQQIRPTVTFTCQSRASTCSDGEEDGGRTTGRERMTNWVRVGVGEKEKDT